MFEDKRILAVVPARGGSQGITLKNLREVCGIPLVGIAGRLLEHMDWIDSAVVSTDHEEIAAVAESYGLPAPFRRPESLSGNRIGDWDVLNHALREMEALERRPFDIVLMLQPTSPLRTPAQVQGCVRMLLEGAYDAVWTVSPTDPKAHPLKQLIIAKDGSMDYYDPTGSLIIARQQLTPVYHRNGVAYAITRECLLEQGSIKGQRAGAFVIDEPLANIDSIEDLEWAEFLAARMDLPWLASPVAS